MNIEKKFDSIIDKHKELEEKIMQGKQALGDEFSLVTKMYSDLQPLVDMIHKYQKLTEDKKQSEELLQDLSIDNELKEIAKEEVISASKALEELSGKIQIELLPKDEDDNCNIIVEIRGGAGGDEAAIFSGDLFRMYHRYAEVNKWKLEVISINESEKNKIKEVSFAIKGAGAYGRLKFESGVHRVQRVPETEASGRLHTSTATVAVLPEVKDIDVVIEDKDIRIDVFRASGAGGQHVNTTDSAVRITHLPTGIVVSQQDEKSQHKNKDKAMKILRARIYDAQKQQAEQERSSNRRSQIGSGDRSERIRTYNFPQGRVTDHRINLTLYKANDIINGDLDEIIDSLIASDRLAKLEEYEATAD